MPEQERLNLQQQLLDMDPGQERYFDLGDDYRLAVKCVLVGYDVAGQVFTTAAEAALELLRIRSIW